MELREETSDAASVLKIPFACLAAEPPSLERTVLVIMGIVVRHGVMSPHPQSSSVSGFEGQTSTERAKKGGCPIPAPRSGSPGSDFRPHPDPALCSSSQKGRKAEAT